MNGAEFSTRDVMAYGQDLPRSARRHWSAAVKLHDGNAPGDVPGNTAVAGYLFGITGELALKHLMIRSGMKPSLSAEKRDPFYVHFPYLKTLLRDQAQGRLSQKLVALASNEALFQNWAIEMRYAGTDQVKEQWVTQWRKNAKELIELMEEF